MANHLFLHHKLSRGIAQQEHECDQPWVSAMSKANVEASNTLKTGLLASPTRLLLIACRVMELAARSDQNEKIGYGVLLRTSQMSYATSLDASGH